MRCAGCSRELKDGVLYIEGAASEFIGKEPNPEVDDLVAKILSGGKTVIYCKACTNRGGPFDVKVYREEET